MLNEQSRLEDFPTLSSMTYLNTAAEGIPSLAVREALVRYFDDHQMGMGGRDRHFAQLEALKKRMGEMFGLGPAETAVCSCSSEAFNMARTALHLAEGDEVIINDLDFPSGATPWLTPSCPATTRIWKSREGHLHLEDLVPLLTSRTRLVTVSLVSFFNGFKIALTPMSEIIRKHSSALLAVDVTQALGRIPLDLSGADLIVSSTHKWILATHGGGLVGVPTARQDELTCEAGGWFNLQDAFGPDRFERAVSQPGAASFAVGMPNFPAIYAIRAALDYIQSIGVEAIDRAARPLTLACLEGLKKLPVELISPQDPEALAGILAFRHPDSARLHRYLQDRDIHIMEHAGRLRVAIHGYNTMDDIDLFLKTLAEAINA